MKGLRNIKRTWVPGIDQYLDRIFHDHDRLRTLLADDDDDTASITAWAPAVDVREEDDRFVVRADLPGVDPKKVDVTLEDGILTIRGERIESKEEEEAGG